MSMNTIFNEPITVNVIIDLILIILGLVAINLCVYYFLKRKAIRITTSVASGLALLAYILCLNGIFNLVLVALAIVITVAFVVNLAEIRNLIANKFNQKKNENLVNKKNGDIEKIYDHESLYKVINETTLYLSNHKIGAIMTFEKKDNLDRVIKNGTRLDCPVSFELLITIFYPGTRLHDGAVVIKGNNIVAASVYYSPTTKPLIGKYGSRHRASIGISEICDAVTIVVSEETGRISIAYNGEIESYPRDQFISAFENLMNEDAPLTNGENGVHSDETIEG